MTPSMAGHRLDVSYSLSPAEKCARLQNACCWRSSFNCNQLSSSRGTHESLAFVSQRSEGVRKVFSFGKTHGESPRAGRFLQKDGCWEAATA